MAELMMNRRRFLIRLGAGAAGGIGGFFLMQRWLMSMRTPVKFRSLNRISKEAW